MGRARKKQSGGRQGLTEREFRRYVALLAVPCVVVVIIIVAMISGAVRESVNETGSGTEPEIQSSVFSEGTDDSKESEKTIGIPVIEPDTKEYFQDFGGSILKKDGSPEVQQLMEQYFKAISDCDLATFFTLFTSQDASEEERYRREFEQQKQYIDGYENISCYTTPGLTDGEMAAYVYYEIRYAGVETPAPSLVRIYAVRGEDGVWRIDDGEPSAERVSYLEQLSVNEDVRPLSLQTDQQMEAAMEADAALRDRVNYMKKGPAWQESEQPSESTEQ